MEENVVLQTYSVADLREWLLHNNLVKGLSPAVIAPARAFAIINNPYVNDEMVVSCALFVNERLAAFTAAFPEVFQKPENRLSWWFTTLWCDPAYAGRGYGLIVVGTLCELMGEGSFFDADGARETVEIFKLLGLETIYVPRYVFSGKKICTNTFRGKMAWYLEKQRQKACARKRRSLLKQLGKSFGLTVTYARFVDDEAYSFIEVHSNPDLFLRKQEMFNWILQYPFMQYAPLWNRVPLDNVFSSIVAVYQSFFIKVYDGMSLVGVAILVLSNRSLSVKYLYYSDDSTEMVFYALAEHVVRLNAVSFQTNDKKLAEYMSQLRLFTKYEVVPRSFSFPKGFCAFDACSLQAGEGDMFV